MSKVSRSPTPSQAEAKGDASDAAPPATALRVAGKMGLLAGPKTKHINAKVPPALFEAAARRVGTASPAVVINAALASLATEDKLGRWLAENWGVLADVDPALLDQIDL